MALEIVTTSERPDLEPEAAAAFRQRWPEFVFHDPVVPAYLPRVQDYFKDLDVLLLVDGHVAAGGWGVPLVWDGTVEDLPTGYDAALVRSVEDHEAARVPTTLSFMAAAVHTDHDAQGLATEVLHALVGRASAAGLTHVVAPIRPTAKHLHPEVPMSDYATWVREDGLSTDPWIRTHQRMGARILGVAAASMVVPGTVAEWEQWAGTALPPSGSFVVPDGLNLLVVDRDADTATYTEENLWVQHPVTSSEVWDEETAARYDQDSAEQFAPTVLGPTLDLLERLAEGGPVLELAIGTGRVGVPLAARGVPVTGIELSEPMVAQLRRKADAAQVPVVVGDMATVLAPGAGDYALVFLVWNTLSNLRTQAEQVQCFRNAARHLRPGGCFVIELWVPPIHRLSPGHDVVPMSLDEEHLVFDTYDRATQDATSHHYHRDPDGTVRHDSGHFRYVWPSECDLMAQLAGLELEARSEDWTGTPFTAASEDHVSVWRKR